VWYCHKHCHNKGQHQNSNSAGLRALAAHQASDTAADKTAHGPGDDDKKLRPNRHLRYGGGHCGWVVHGVLHFLGHWPDGHADGFHQADDDNARHEARDDFQDFLYLPAHVDSFVELAINWRIAFNLWQSKPGVRMISEKLRGQGAQWFNVATKTIRPI
jgi:hypothetical protein